MDDRGVMHTTHPFNAPKAQHIRIQLQTLAAHRITVAELGLGVRDQLTSTIHAQVILFATSMPIFANVFRAALRTLHRHLRLLYIPQLCNANVRHFEKLDRAKPSMSNGSSQPQNNLRKYP